MLTCPLRWTLQYAGGLRPGLRQSLPEAGKLLGLIAHRVAEEAFRPGPPPVPEEVEAYAGRRLPELLPQMAATLLLPEFAAELSAAKAAIPSALGELARFLHDDGLTVVGVEIEFSEPDTLSPGFGVSGRIDMRATTRAGRPVVIDLKWYRTDSYVRMDLKLGTAIQVGVYGRHVSDPSVDARVGYFMLRQSRFLTTDPGGAGVMVEGPSAKDTWDKVAASFGAVVADMGTGRIRSAVEHRRLKDHEKYDDPYLLAPPRCVYCEFAGICGEE
jgi:ATP-dependent helicase/nuclease subunit B